MSCYSKEQLESMLEDVVNELNLSEDLVNKHGQLGTPPAELVRMTLGQKDKTISLLNRGFVNLAEVVYEKS